MLTRLQLAATYQDMRSDHGGTVVKKPVLCPDLIEWHYLGRSEIVYLLSSLVS
jgi:hypothetical protein